MKIINAEKVEGLKNGSIARSWREGLKNILAPDFISGAEQDKWYGIVEAFVADIEDRAYFQALDDLLKEAVDITEEDIETVLKQAESNKQLYATAILRLLKGEKE